MGKKRMKTRTIDGSPLGFLLEKTHGLDIVGGIGSEAVVDASRLFRRNKQMSDQA